jgi:hypothetical protein
MSLYVFACLASLLSIGWFLASPGWEPSIATVGSIGAILTLETRRRVKPQLQPLIIDDLLVNTYPPQVDIRIRNPNRSTASVSRVLFKILDLQLGPSPCAKQDVSDRTTLKFDISVELGTILEVQVAVKVEGNSTARILIDVAWSGPPPDWGRFYTVVAGLKTSCG